MSALIFRLRNVPEEEANQVRSLLDESRIDWFETSAGNWGIGMPGLWVKNADDATRARELIDSFQQELETAEKARFRELQKSGRAPTLVESIQARPFAMLAILIFCLFIIYISINPFLQLAQTSR